MKFINKKILTTVLITLVSITVFWVVIQRTTTHSAPYTYAEHYLKDSKIVADELGTVTDVHLSVFSNLSIQEVGGSGSANFEIKITGTNGSALARIRLLKKSDVWSVETGDITTNTGKQIVLQP